MKIKEAVYETCKCCGTRKNTISEEIYGCDVCKKEINMNNPGEDYLRLSVHDQQSAAQWKEVCSWACASKLVKSLIKNKAAGWFISLPYVSMDIVKKGCTAKDFLKILK